MFNKAVSVQVKELPESLRSALASVGYGARDIGVEPREEISAESQGDQGQRGFVLLVELATGRTEKHMGSWGGANPFEARQVDLDTTKRPIAPGFAVIKGTTGYPRTFATIYLHPTNVAPLLPAGPEVTEREKTILTQFRSLTSAGRKDEWARNRASRPTEAELDSLVGRGLLSRNKAGAIAITTAGKNASRA